MSQYLLSTYAVEGEAPRAPATPEEMGAFMKRVAALEEEMEASGTFVFGGALHGPDAATVLRSDGGDVVMTDGPFVEAKEHIGGFYIKIGRASCREREEGGGGGCMVEKDT